MKWIVVFLMLVTWTLPVHASNIATDAQRVLREEMMRVLPNYRATFQPESGIEVMIIPLDPSLAFVNSTIAAIGQGVNRYEDIIRRYFAVYDGFVRDYFTLQIFLERRLGSPAFDFRDLDARIGIVDGERIVYGVADFSFDDFRTVLQSPRLTAHFVIYFAWDDVSHLIDFDNTNQLTIVYHPARGPDLRRVSRFGFPLWRAPFQELILEAEMERRLR